MARTVAANDPNAVDALRNDNDYRQNFGSPEGTPVVVTYSFARGGDFPGVNAGYVRVDRYMAMSSDDKADVRAALAVYEAATGVHFIEVSDDGQLDFMTAVGGDGFSWAYYPVAAGQTQPVVINAEVSSYYGIGRGEPGHWVLLHEIGHAMGLKHSFEGRTILRRADDNHDTTVMSYTDGKGAARDLRPLDVEALRSYYGPAVFDDWKVSLNAARTVVTIRDNGGSHQIATAWYALDIAGNGGKDTLLGNDTDDTLDGGAGRDTIHGRGGHDLAKGGTGADLVFGEDAGDTMKGGRGDDTVYGGVGNDELWGDNGNDVLSGGDHDDTLYGRRHDDRLQGGPGNDALRAGGGDNRLDGGVGRDSLFANGGDDTMFGGSQNDTLRSGMGDDRLFGGDGDDLLYGSAGNDSLVGGRGNDTLLGANGEDTLEGGVGNDRLRGGPRDDILFGGEGDDYLDGGKGSDLLVGGDGDDTLRSGTVSEDTALNGGAGDDLMTLSLSFGTVETVVYRTGDGFDEVRGLRAEDILDIDVAGLADADVRHLAAEVGADVEIDFGGGSGLLLRDFTLSALDEVTIL